SHCHPQGLGLRRPSLSGARLQQGFTTGGMGSDRHSTILRTECPLWVNNGHRGKLGECPVYPQKRTSLEPVGMSALCQKRTSRPPPVLLPYWPPKLGKRAPFLASIDDRQSDSVVAADA